MNFCNEDNSFYYFCNCIQNNILYNRKIYMMRNLFVVLAFIALVSSCGDKDKQTNKEPVKVKVEKVANDNPYSGDEYVGTVESSLETILSFELGGNITHLSVKEGDHVIKGQLLGTVSPTSLKNTHAASLAVLHQAQDAWRRMKKLHAEGVVSEIKWVEVDSKLKEAEAAERVAREQLSHTSLYAPFSGVITDKLGEVGMNVLPDQPVLKLAGGTNVDVVFSVPEGDINAIKIGDVAEVFVKAADSKTYSGVVKEKSVVADKVSHSYNVRLGLQTSDGKLLSGMVCSVRMKSQVHSNLIILPMDCIELDTDNVRYVWIVVAGKAHRKNVIVGDFCDGGIIIRSGLSVGDKVIVEGTQKVSEGMVVKEI